MNPQETQVRRRLQYKMIQTLQGTPDAGEQELQEALLTSFSPSAFPHAVDVEWEYVPGLSQYGRGDLVFASDPSATFFAAHPPAKILVVEVKYIDFGYKRNQKTASTKRTKARKKVLEQITKSMDAWQNRHPKDLVYGCEYTNENYGRRRKLTKRVTGLPDVDVYLPTLHELRNPSSTSTASASSSASALGILSSESEDEKEDEEEKEEEERKPVQLQLELVPMSAWGKNYKPSIHEDLWKTLSTSEKTRAGNRCEACGATASPLVLHQHWDLDDDCLEMSFARFEVLCWTCHDVKHFGRAQLQGREEPAVRQLKRISGWSDEEVAEHINSSGLKWRERSQLRDWQIDLGAFNTLPAVRKWLSENPALTIGRFGNLCCMGAYSSHPPINR